MPPTPSSRYWARRRSRVAGVQARGDPARHGAVLGAVGVEQEERHAADVDAPDLRDDLLGADRDGDGDRLAVVAGDERHRQALGVGRHPVLVLPARRVDPLAEVALAVEQADGDERQRAVGGLLEDVAGQRPEAAGVDRQRGVDAVLRAEEAHRTLGAGRPGGLRGPGEVGADALLERPAALDQVVVGGRALQCVGQRLGQQADRVLAAQLPALADRRRERRQRRRASTTSAGCRPPAPAGAAAWARERQAPPRPGRCPHGRATRARMIAIRAAIRSAATGGRCRVGASTVPRPSTLSERSGAMPSSWAWPRYSPRRPSSRRRAISRSPSIRAGWSGRQRGDQPGDAVAELQREVRRRRARQLADVLDRDLVASGPADGALGFAHGLLDCAWLVWAFLISRRESMRACVATEMARSSPTIQP